MHCKGGRIFSPGISFTISTVKKQLQVYTLCSIHVKVPILDQEGKMR